MYRLRDVCDDAYRVPAARSFMCKGEALLRLTMRCQCYAERQLKVADRLVEPRAVELPSRRNLRLGRRGAAEEHERGSYVSSSDCSFAVRRLMQRGRRAKQVQGFRGRAWRFELGHLDRHPSGGNHPSRDNYVGASHWLQSSGLGVQYSTSLGRQTTLHVNRHVRSEPGKESRVIQL